METKIMGINIQRKNNEQSIISIVRMLGGLGGKKKAKKIKNLGCGISLTNRQTM